jgi:hypothetical protein
MIKHYFGNGKWERDVNKGREVALCPHSARVWSGCARVFPRTLAPNKQKIVSKCQ